MSIGFIYSVDIDFFFLRSMQTKTCCFQGFFKVKQFLQYAVIDLTIRMRPIRDSFFCRQRFGFIEYLHTTQMLIVQREEDEQRSESRFCGGVVRRTREKKRQRQCQSCLVYISIDKIMLVVKHHQLFILLYVFFVCLFTSIEACNIWKASDCPQPPTADDEEIVCRFYWKIF